jgi:parallel beta-helix repeat protein
MHYGVSAVVSAEGDVRRVFSSRMGKHSITKIKLALHPPTSVSFTRLCAAAIPAKESQQFRCAALRHSLSEEIKYMTSRFGSWKLLVPSLLLLAFGTSQFAAAVVSTLCVNPAGSGGCYRTISAAVAAAGAGSTINVAAGTYREQVVIGKSLFLMGAGSTRTVINAAGLANAIYVDGLDNVGLSGVTVQGFKLENANFEGFAATSVSNLNFSNNLVTGNDKSQDTANGTCPGLPGWETAEGLDCGEGIHLAGTSYSTIANNVSEGNAGGLLITDNTAISQYNVIAGNTIKDNLYDCGITQPSQPQYPSTANGGVPFGVSNNVYYNNTVTGNGTSLAGAGAGILLAVGAPGESIKNTMIIGNTFTNNGLPGVVFHGHNSGDTMSGTIVAGNTISGNGQDVGDAATPGKTGINFFGAHTSTVPGGLSGSQIYGNTISNEDDAIIYNSGVPLVVHLNNIINAGSNGINNIDTTGIGSVDASQNYWGCTTGPSSSGCSALVGSNVTVNPYVATTIVY